MREKINEIGNRNTMEKTKSWSFEKINTIVKTLASQKKERRFKLVKSGVKEATSQKWKGLKVNTMNNCMPKN